MTRFLSGFCRRSLPSVSPWGKGTATHRQPINSLKRSSFVSNCCNFALVDQRLDQAKTEKFNRRTHLLNKDTPKVYRILK